jgi:hypothetical protein
VSDENVPFFISIDTPGMTATAGIQVNPNNGLGSNCYALVCDGSFDDPITPGLSLVDLCGNGLLQTLVLPITKTGSSSMANDVAILNGIAYVTDYTGSQIWSVVVTINSAGVPSLSNPRAVLTSSNCVMGNPSSCIDHPDSLVAVTNGGYLIISSYGTGLVKYDPSTGKSQLCLPFIIIQQF